MAHRGPVDEDDVVGKADVFHLAEPAHAALAGQLYTALCNTGRDGMDSGALGLLYDELSGIKR